MRMPGCVIGLEATAPLGFSLHTGTRFFPDTLRVNLVRGSAASGLQEPAASYPSLRGECFHFHSQL